jgi:peptidoglycan hydrolase-like protein with peptidoglycan-binding domain
MKPSQSNTSQVNANNNNNSRVCFNCRETGHFIANCPYAKKPTTSAFSNSVNGPRPLVSGANSMPVRINNNFGNNNNQQMRQPQQSFGRARVNHINAHEAQEA